MGRFRCHQVWFLFRERCCGSKFHVQDGSSCGIAGPHALRSQCARRPFEIVVLECARGWR
jgi:hypothetical protein